MRGRREVHEEEEEQEKKVGEEKEMEEEEKDGIRGGKDEVMIEEN